MRSIVFLGCLFAVILIGCPGLPPRGPYPDDNNFKEAEEDFLVGNYQAALTHYEVFIQTYPNSSYRIDATYRMGLCYLGLGEYDKARETLSKALNIKPSPSLNAQILAAMARACLFKKEYIPAAGYYKKALDVQGNELPLDEIFFNLATALMRSGQWQEGIDYFKRLINQYPDSHFSEAAKERLYLPPNSFVVQLGRFESKENAQQALSELQRDKGIDASLKTLLIDGEEFYFIWAGRFSFWLEAFKKAEEIQAKGIDAIVIP